MVVSKQTKEYIISLIRQALDAMKKNQFEDAEDLLRSAKGELHDANMGISVENSINAIKKFGLIR